jgi:hypothetical protein
MFPNPDGIFLTKKMFRVREITITIVDAYVELYNEVHISVKGTSDSYPYMIFALASSDTVHLDLAGASTN